MGLRACALKKREVELADRQVLNWASEVLENVIQEFCEDCFCGGEYGDTACTWEVQKDEFKNMIGQVEKLTDDEFQERFGRTASDPSDKVTRTVMIDALKTLYEDGLQAGKANPHARKAPSLHAVRPPDRTNARIRPTFRR